MRNDSVINWLFTNWFVCKEFCDYKNQIRATIEGVKDEYQSDESANAPLLWEMVKSKVREQTLRYAKKKRAKVLPEEELEKKINTLQRQIGSGCNNAKEKVAINIQLEEKTRTLEKIIESVSKLNPFTAEFSQENAFFLTAGLIKFFVLRC